MDNYAVFANSATSRRRRWAVRCLAGCAGLLVFTLLANFALGRYLHHRILEEAACRLPEGASVRQVEVNGNPLLSLLRGHLDSVVIHSRDFALGPNTGVKADVIVRVTGVLMDRDVPLEQRISSATLELGLEAGPLQQLTAAGSGAFGPHTHLAIADGVLRASTTGVDSSVSVTLTPSVANGDIRLTPSSVRIGNRTFAPELLAGVRKDSPLTTAAADLLQPRDIDVPQLMPRVDPVSARVVGDQLRLKLGVDDQGVADYVAANAARAAASGACA